METKLKFWPTFIFGPLYLGWRGFPKEALLLFIAHVSLGYFVLGILLFGIPDPYITIISFSLMFLVHFLAFKFWYRYASRFKVKQYHRAASFIFIFLIYYGSALYWAISEIAHEQGIDTMTLLKKEFEFWKNPRLNPEAMEKLLEAFGKVR